MPIVTAANYNAYRNTSSTSQDTQITALILQITDYAQTVLGLTFETATLTERYTIRAGQQTIQLRTFPVQSVTSIKCFYGTESGDSNTLAASTYYTNLTTGLVSIAGAGQASMIASERAAFFNSSMNDFAIGQMPCFTPGIDNHEVVYVGGRATVPDGLKNCVYRALDLMLATAGDDPEMKSEAILGYSYTKTDTSTTSSFAKQMQMIFSAYANGATLV